MKAIIPAAGLGTRFLPATKCTPKEMLPVLDKPVIQYVVEEALEPSEVDGAVIVTSPGKPELLSYFQPDKSLEGLLRERGKTAYADAVAAAGEMPVDFRYQYEPKRPGPRHPLGGRRRGRRELPGPAGRLRRPLARHLHPHARGLPRPRRRLRHRGGPLRPLRGVPLRRHRRRALRHPDRARGRGRLRAGRRVARLGPGGEARPQDAPSNLYIVGRYLLSPLVMELLADQEPGCGGEIQLTDAMARSLEREAMYAVVIDPLSGYDTGTPSGWIATNALMAASDPRFADEFWEAVEERGGLHR